MSQGHDLDYEALINRTIKNFEPVKRLWPIRIRFLCWTLLESIILALAGALSRRQCLSPGIDYPGLIVSSGLSITASLAAAFLALRSAVPGCEITWRALVLLTAVVIGTVALPSATPSGVCQGIISAVQLLGLAALPWSALFWAVRRGVPLQPQKSGAVIGLSAFSLALAALRLIHCPELPDQVIWLAASLVLVVAVSTLGGALWLNWIAFWQRSQRRDGSKVSQWFNARPAFPMAVAAAVGAFMFVLVRGGLTRIPDFDLAIDNYQSSLAGFRANVPSASVESVLAAYVEHGMPAYMWDFGPQGFKLIGGLWQPLPDGTPVTFTCFRGTTGGVICMMKQTDAFKPPPGALEVERGLLFYRYRGFSICLINIGGYGDFLSVIAAPMPMRQFVALIMRIVE
jgi:Negative regulator of sigma F